MPAEDQPRSERTGPFEIDLDLDVIRAFAEVTRDPRPDYLAGRAVPPTLLASLIYRAQAASMDELIAPTIFRSIRGGVHGQHEILLHRPLRPGEQLLSFVEPWSMRPAKGNLRVTFRHPAYDETGVLVAEQWWTTVLLGVSAEPCGPDLADLSVPELDRSIPLSAESLMIDAEMVQRYAELSGDFSAHHFDLELARQSGFDALFLHGLCTMALCAGAGLRALGKADPRSVRRVALRFASPAFLDHQLELEVFEVDEGRVALEASCEGRPVIRHGLVELDPSS